MSSQSGKTAIEEKKQGAAQQLLTREIIERLPAIGATDGEDEPTAQVKFFNPNGSGTWYASEANAVTDGAEVPLTPESFETADDVLFYGRVFWQADEYGYFRLSDLLRVQGPLTGIERDIHFEPQPIGEVSG
jgi:hypothetical protein